MLSWNLWSLWSSVCDLGLLSVFMYFSNRWFWCIFVLAQQKKLCNRSLWRMCIELTSTVNWLQDNPMTSRLYLSGVYFFILMYTGSNILPVATFLHYTHLKQAFRSETVSFFDILLQFSVFFFIFYGLPFQCRSGLSEKQKTTTDRANPVIKP